MPNLVPGLPLLGILLSAACFCGYCWADRRTASVGVSAAFCWSSGVFFVCKYLLFVYQPVTSCDLAWRVSTTGLVLTLVKVMYDGACRRLYSKYALREMVSFSTFQALTPKCERQNEDAIFTVFWELYFSLSSKFLKLNCIPLTW